MNENLIQSYIQIFSDLGQLSYNSQISLGHLCYNNTSKDAVLNIKQLTKQQLSMHALHACIMHAVHA